MVCIIRVGSKVIINQKIIRFHWYKKNQGLFFFNQIFAKKVQFFLQMKVGLFFGSFNPIHVGHLVIANFMATQTDLDKIKAEEEKVREELSKESENNENQILEGNEEIKLSDPVEKLEDESKEKINNEKKFPSKRYKIQEVIKPNQVILVQVLKDERGFKGAALSTFISIAGKYIVLMPNTAKGGGISRKIFNPGDRKKIRKILNEIEIPKEMGIIVRTAGSNKTKNEIDGDLKNLIIVWNQ